MHESFVALTCTECGKGAVVGGLFSSRRFPTIRLCWTCIKDAQLILYRTCGFIPYFPWLVMADGLWRTDTWTFSSIPQELIDVNDSGHHEASV